LGKDAQKSFRKNSNSPPIPNQTFLQVSKEVHRQIALILSNAASLKKLLRTQSSQLKDESLARYQS